MRKFAVFEAQILEGGMMGRVAREAQIFGINFWIVSAAVGAATIAFSLLAGELLDFYPAIFEVV